MKITADTITDEQIRELRVAMQIDRKTFETAVYRRVREPTDERPCERTKARARCAEILNARGGK